MITLPTVPIGELVEKVSKWQPRDSADNKLIDYIDIGSVDQDSKEVADVAQVFAHEAPSRAQQLVQENDVLVSTVRPNLNAVAILSSEHDGATGSTGFCVLRAKSTNLCARYLYHWVRTPRFVGAMMARATGASYPAVSSTIVNESKIPLPPLPEQMRIAAILDNADAIRRKRQQAIQLTEQFLRSTFLDMFGDPVTNPKDWPVLPFGKVATNEDSKRVPVKEADRENRHGAYPYYGSVGIIDYIDGYLFDGEYLLISEDGKHLEGRNRPIACIATGQFWVNNHAHVVKTNGKADLWYLAFHLENRPIRHFVTGIDQFKLNRSSLDRIPIPIPPLELQESFRSIRNATSNMTGKTASSKDCVDNLFNALVQRAFRGEL